MLVSTLGTGVRADLVVTGFAITASFLLAVMAGVIVFIVRRGASARRVPVRALAVAAAVTVVVAFLVETLDLGYYRYSGQRLDFVFLEYVGDVLEELTTKSVVDTQVGRQTVAEVHICLVLAVPFELSYPVAFRQRVRSLSGWPAQSFSTRRMPIASPASPRDWTRVSPSYERLLSYSSCERAFG